MFTGLVETVGIVRQATGSSPRRVTISSSIATAEVAIGDSVAIDGCCLTVVAKSGDTLSFEAATETLERTTLGKLDKGAKVNLERALRLGDRLGGHLVSGHVDGLGKLVAKEMRGSALYLGVEAPEDVAHLIASQGSITIAGVSLTVTSVEGRVFYVGLIPHTLEVTTLGERERGDLVNLEVDLIARYLERLVEAKRPAGTPSLTREFLKDKGFL